MTTKKVTGTIFDIEIIRDYGFVQGSRYSYNMSDGTNGTITNHCKGDDEGTSIEGLSKSVGLSSEDELYDVMEGAEFQLIDTEYDMDGNYSTETFKIKFTSPKELKGKETSFSTYSFQEDEEISDEDE